MGGSHNVDPRLAMIRGTNYIVSLGLTSGLPTRGASTYAMRQRPHEPTGERTQTEIRSTISRVTHRSRGSMSMTDVKRLTASDYL